MLRFCRKQQLAFQLLTHPQKRNLCVCSIFYTEKSASIGVVFVSVPITKCSRHIATPATATAASKTNLRSYHNTNQEALHTITSTIPTLGHGIQVGQYAFKERSYSREDVQKFATLVQDWNPIHSALDRDLLFIIPEEGENASSSSSSSWWDIHHANGLLQFQESYNNKNDTQQITTRPIVHGMLVSSIFSSIFGTLSPGCIYMNQSLNFVRPVYVDDTVVGRIEIEKIRKWRQGGVVVQCTTNVTRTYQEENNREDSKQLPVDTIIASTEQSLSSFSNVVLVKGVANVWLPTGYVL
jgi:acyl dehydratase